LHRKHPIRRDNIIYLKKTIGADPSRIFSAFRTSQAPGRWYDSDAHVSQFKVGGEVRADFFPGYRLVAILKNQLIAQEFETVIDGMGLWSFVATAGKTRVIFDH